MACPPVKQLIINADDFGLLPEINRAVIECFQAGSLTSATLMVNAAGTAEAAAMAGQHPTLAVGLHFCLTQGRPVSPRGQVPSLVDSGGLFWRRREFERRVLSGRIRRQDVRRELAAQVEVFRGTGLALSHIDSHHHVHAFPPVFAEVARYARDQGVALRVPRVAFRHMRSLRGRQSLHTLLKKIFLTALVAICEASAGDGVVCAARLLSIYDITPLPQRVSAAHYTRLLRDSKAGVTELMVHPAFLSPVLEQFFAGSRLKDMERRALCRRSLIAAAARIGFKAASYHDISPCVAAGSAGRAGRAPIDSQGCADP